jgi:hypothetical protein
MESLKNVSTDTPNWEDDKEGNPMNLIITRPDEVEEHVIMKSTITVDPKKNSTPVRGRGRSEELKTQNKNEGKIYVPQSSVNQRTNTMPRRPRNGLGFHTQKQQINGQRKTYGNYYIETNRCYNCHKTGHYIRDCWHQLRENVLTDKEHQIEEAHETMEKRNIEIVEFTNRLREAHEIIKQKTQEVDEIIKEMTISQGNDN